MCFLKTSTYLELILIITEKYLQNAQFNTLYYNYLFLYFTLGNL